MDIWIAGQSRVTIPRNISLASRVRSSMAFLWHFLLGVLCAVSLLAEGDKAEKNWSLSTSLGNSVGIGSFVIGYASQPLWTTSLSINPSYQLKSFWGLPPVSLSASETMGFWWLNSYATGIYQKQNRVSFSDLSLSASMSNILEYKPWGLSLGAGLDLMLPTSTLSRNISRIMRLGFNIPMSWSKSGFRVGWTPSFSGWIYAQNYISGPCFEIDTLPFNAFSNDSEISNRMQGLVLVSSSNQKVGGGQCMVSGRQSTLALNNYWSAGWSNPNHSVSLGLGWFVSFLRPLEDRPELKGSYASGQNYTEATMGRIAYTYTIPIETSLSVSGGVVSVQSSYRSDGSFAFPFFDFVTPGNNQTEFFINATVGI